MFTHSIPTLFSREQTEAIIALSKAAGDTSNAGLVKGVVEQSIRRANIAWLDDTGDAAWVMDKIVSAVAAANRDAFQFDITDFKERLQVAAYEERWKAIMTGIRTSGTARWPASAS